MKKILYCICALFIVIFIVGLIYLFDFLNQDSLQIPVLTYHHFLSDEELLNFDNSENYAVSVSNFEKQLKYLSDNGYQTITLEDLICWKNKKCKLSEKSVLITIDDGLTSAFRYAKPLLEKYNFQAVLFTIASRTQDNTPKWDGIGYEYIGKDIIDSNDGKTIIIASHSNDLHHMKDGKKAVNYFDSKMINEDFKVASDILSTKYMSYPYNTYNKNALKALKDNDYLLAFKGSNKKTFINENKYLISRIFVSNDFDNFENIFETNNNNQSNIDKIKGLLVYYKNRLF